LKATLVKEGGNVEHTFYFPVVDNTEDRNPLEFEKSMQYTFNLELQASSGFNAFQITFSGVTATIWQDGEGALDTQLKEYPLWAQSNIYFQPDEGKTDIGSLTFSEDDSSKSGYQGLYFKWGSLIGVAAGANSVYNLANTYLYIPDLSTGPNEGKYYKVLSGLVLSSYSSGSSNAINLAVQAYTTKQTNGNWINIPSAVDADGDLIDSEGDNSFLTDASDQTFYESYKGDICKFLSDKKVTNGSGLTRNWVMPVNKDFGLGEDGPYSLNEGNEFIFNDAVNSNKYENVSKSDWNGEDDFVSLSVDGTGYTNSNKALMKYTTATGEEVVFPAAGSRNGESDDVGDYGAYWSSSAYFNTSNAYYMRFLSSSVYPGNSGDGGLGYSVRCVQEL
jgi:hypothetical protein